MPSTTTATPAGADIRESLPSAAGILSVLILCGATTATAQEAARRALFGDLHVHTRDSFDAFIFGTRSTPDDAYEFAKAGLYSAPRLRHPELLLSEYPTPSCASV